MDNKPKPIKNKKVSPIVDEALRLNRSIKKAATRLEELKEKLRGEAKSLWGETGDRTMVSFEASKGGHLVSVCDGGTRTSPLPTADLLALRDVIAAEAWDDLFEERVAFTGGQKELDKLAATRPTDHAAVMECMQVKANEPHVLLPR